MSRIGITYNEVAKAAEDIFKNGETPTIDKVRMLLGTGSFSTISKYLNDWRHGTIPNESIVIKNQKSDIVQVAVERVWRQIREETDAEITAIRTETQELLNGVKIEKDSAIKKSKELEECLVKLKEEFNALHAIKEILALDYKKIQEDYAILQERYKGLDERYADFQRITVRHQEDMNQAHKNEIGYLQEKLKQQEEHHQNIISEMKKYQEDQRNSFVLEIDKLKTTNIKLNNNLENSHATLRMNSEDIIKLTVEMKSLLKERDQLSQQMAMQKKYWGLMEKNNQITNSIWAEVKEIPKFDSTLSSLNYLLSTNKFMHEYAKKIFDISNTTKSFMEKYSKVLEKVENE